MLPFLGGHWARRALKPSARDSDFGSASRSAKVKAADAAVSPKPRASSGCFEKTVAVLGSFSRILNCQRTI